MEKATIIGIDLAKRVFQVHAASKDGRPVLRKKVSRAQLLGFLAKQPPTIVAMEACATAHEWGRAISGLGHDVRLVPPIYVKPLCVSRRTTPLTPRRSPRRPQGQRCALWR
jgi:transposase